MNLWFEINVLTLITLISPTSEFISTLYLPAVICPEVEKKLTLTDKKGSEALSSLLDDLLLLDAYYNKNITLSETDFLSYA